MNSNMVEPESFDHLHRDAQTLSLFYSFLASHFSVYFLVILRLLGNPGLILVSHFTYFFY